MSVILARTLDSYCHPTTNLPRMSGRGKKIIKSSRFYHFAGDGFKPPSIKITMQVFWRGSIMKLSRGVYFLRIRQKPLSQICNKSRTRSHSHREI